MVGEQRQQQLPDGVIAEVGRDDIRSSASDPACGRCRGAGSRAASGSANRLAQSAMLRQDRLGVVVGMKMQGEEEVARRLGEVRIQLDRLDRGCQDVIEAALIGAAAQVASGLGRFGIEPEGAPVGGDRLVEPPLVRPGRCPGCCGPRHNRA